MRAWASARSPRRAAASRSSTFSAKERCGRTRPRPPAGQGRPHMIQVDGIILRQQQGLANDVFQFAHVAGPGLRLQKFAWLRHESMDVALPNAGRACCRKYRTRSGISSVRWRKGGRRDHHHIQPIIQVFAKLLFAGWRFPNRDAWPPAPAHPQEWFPCRRAVAGIFPEARATACTWVFRVISPISSRKMVPPCACSKRPMRRACAPVNAPRSWPNNSLSSSVSGMAAQLMAMNGALARSLCW